MDNNTNPLSTPTTPITSGPVPPEPATPQPITSTPSEPTAPQPITSMPPNPTQTNAPTTVENQTNSQNDRNYQGIYGWLIVFAINLLLNGVYNLLNLGQTETGVACKTLNSLFKNSCDNLNNFVTTGNVFMIILSVLYFINFALIMSRKKIAKMATLIILAIESLVIIVMAIFGFQILAPLESIPNLSSEIAESKTKIIIAVIYQIAYSIGWSIYFLKSKRVKKTLVK